MSRHKFTGISDAGNLSTEMDEEAVVSKKQPAIKRG
jgi:hypothetical protein